MEIGSFLGIRILSWFLEHPNEKVHFKDLCRKLKLSPLSVKTYCEQFINRDWILEERKANLRFFYLNIRSYVVKAMKRTWFLENLRHMGVDKIVPENIISFALYGSHASGEYTEKSDIDLLVIGRKEQVNYANVKILEEKMHKEIQITVIQLNRWEKNKKTDPFILSVLKNHVLLTGTGL